MKKQQSGDGKYHEMAGAKAETESKRKQDQSGETDRKRISWIYILKIDSGMETRTAGGQEGETLQ